MAKSTQITAINKTITHKEWHVPMSYHRLTRVEHSLITKETVATFASYFSKDAYESGARELDYISIILPLAVDNFTDVITAVVNHDDAVLSKGEGV